MTFDEIRQQAVDGQKNILQTEQYSFPLDFCTKLLALDIQEL
jgi:hypothetical protein